MCKALRPFEGIVSQGFGANKNPLYASQGLQGHAGIDFVSFKLAKLGVGDTVRAVVPGVVYDIFYADDPDPSHCKEVRVLYHCDEHDLWYSVQYAHFSSIQVKIGDELNAGDPIGIEGNTGDVYANGRPVTTAERRAGSTAGSHVHIEWLELRPGAQPNQVAWNLADHLGRFVQHDGNYFVVPGHYNGYEGAFDWSKYLPALEPQPTISGVGTALAAVVNAFNATKENRGQMVFRVCREEKLPASLAIELWATICGESEFNPNAKCFNKDHYGNVVSVDYGLCQLNSYWYIGPTKTVKTPFEALTNPEKCVRVMAKAFNAGRANDWIIHRTGKHLPFMGLARNRYDAYTKVDG
jgi:hypothetical protein